MAKLANEILCSEGSNVDGLVITHGTDTAEETLYFSKYFGLLTCMHPLTILVPLQWMRLSTVGNLSSLSEPCDPPQPFLQVSAGSYAFVSGRS
jgi:hypothetical protein